ncbi:hypothetical protein NP590_17865 [Methylomonas sp. SURF-2]|uniref:Uncharacterized protein n=1 Tax=Methylomonas subterranea TaxID=2952225 RepID=A0ABT1TKK3_9GAMM|nr:hypothetical protein [Methylomonas sp. SURF-2]MCQ8105980.1 hypothetical protein [Methylomonas sp. SURF-2]
MTTMLADVIRHYLADSIDLQSQPVDQHHATQSENNLALTPVLPDPESVIPQQPAPRLAVIPVIPVTPQNSKPQQNNVNKLNVQDQSKLLAYLNAIGETDSTVIDEFLSECAASPDILHYALQLAEDTLRIHHGDTRRFVRCASCRLLQVSEQRCSQFGWRIVVDKWRRYQEFSAMQ